MKHHHPRLACFVGLILICVETGEAARQPDATFAPKRPAAQFQAALQSLRQGNLAEAEQRFTRIAGDHPGTMMAEKGLYYLAECQFRAKEYDKAHSSYQRLITAFPATEYHDRLIEREYTIARIWLARSNPNPPFNEKPPEPARLETPPPIVGDLASALVALDDIRQNDPTGPYADDATLEIAELYRRHNAFDSALLYYHQFIAEYPRSELLPYARLGATKARNKDTSHLKRAETPRKTPAR